MDACALSALLYFLVPAASGCVAPSLPAPSLQAAPFPYFDADAPYSACRIDRPYSTLLTARDRCEMEAIAKRCSPADDCLVRCIATGLNQMVGGGCWHVCFNTAYHLREWTDPPGIELCDRIPHGAP